MAEKAESMIISHTKETFPGLIVPGMAANAVFGENRMGPVFGGMMLSGEYTVSRVIRELYNPSVPDPTFFSAFA